MKAEGVMILGVLVFLSCSPARGPTDEVPYKQSVRPRDEGGTSVSVESRRQALVETGGHAEEEQAQAPSGGVASAVKRDEPEEANGPLTPTYEITQIDDVSYATVKRYNARVRVPKVLSQNELETVSTKIVESLKVRKPHNALAIFFYLPESDLRGAYTAGKAEWAPYGDWARAGEVRTGNYSRHRLKLTPGNATGIDPQEVRVPGLSTQRKKKIFFDLVAAQDRGVGDNEAYGIIARRYGIDERVVRKIVVEGIAQGWPMP